MADLLSAPASTLIPDPTGRQFARQLRRNWLLVAGDAGLRTAAILMSLCASAKRHAINPWNYLTDLLCLLAAKPTDVTPLLRDAWAKLHPTAGP